MRLATLTLIIVMAAACPGKGSGSGWAPTLPDTGRPEARERFEKARAKVANAELDTGRLEMESIVRDYPDDPIVPHATLFGAIAAHQAGDDAAAAAALEPLVADETAPPEVRKRARYTLGLAEAALGRHAQARELLTPFVAELREGDDAVELSAAMAEATAGSGDAAGALPFYDRYFAGAAPPERAYVLSRVGPLVSGLGADEASAAYGKANKDGPSAAFLGQRLAASERAAGRTDRAREILNETAAARQAAGLVAPADEIAAGDPQLVGAVLPLSGKRRLVGEASSRGLALSAGTFDRAAGGGVAVDGVPQPFSVILEDTGDGKDRAAAAVDTLARKEVIAAVGPVDRDAAEEAGRRAEALGLPLVTLEVTESSGEAAGMVFHLVLSVEARARALAQAAAARGLKRVAILAPDIAYGARASAAFRKELEALGGTVVVEQKYPATATSFVGPVGAVAKAGGFDALFIPDTASRLELVAPQLAVADLVVQPAAAKKPKRGRVITLLATAEGVTPKFLRGSGRYASGALLAPGFFPDELDARIGPYVARFRLAHGEDPTFLDAYAYDAALIIRAAIEGGARDRAAVAGALGALSPSAPQKAALTGDVWFDGGHARGDRGVLYTVVPDASGGFGIRAVR